MSRQIQNQTLGRGEVHFSKFKPGTLEPEGFRYLGDTNDFNLTANTEELPYYSMDRGTKVKTKSVTLQVDHNGNFTCTDISLDNLAFFFMGLSLTNTQAGATGVTETIEGVQLGLSYQIGQTAQSLLGVRSVTLNTATVGATPLVEGTDYQLDAPRGILTILEGATNVSAGASVELNYDVAAVNVDRTISGNTQIEGAIRFDAYNAEGDDKDYRMLYVRLSPNGDLALKGDDWMTTPFNVECLRPPGMEAIYVDGQPYTA
ncbi:hypothetical protein [Alterisphingorhabdus coralli]|uniref:Major tail protein n=1 Tax=Alterisphingorhabdus coralli TaxID=3071408 RepID=A0AA97F9D7_9SPHN|nr:hypothetical protein [Parasphingorhabdus sp. SCSIO 66989]WOE76321.1 hypothetical protein RB602_06310 [Parasphingorhabdus sp. SCSIO 66989]